MIVAERNGELLLTRQDDHARQAGETARHWGDGSPDRPHLDGAVILGIKKHDFGWREPDTEVVYDEENGRPVDFRGMDPGRHITFYRNGYQEALSHDPYAGLMVGMHWIGLYTRRFGYDPTFAYLVPDQLEEAFEKTISAQEREWTDIKQKLWSPADESRGDFEDRVWMHYEIVQVMDLLSLFVHLNDLHEDNETTLASFRFRPDLPYRKLSVSSPGDGSVSLDPFPFDGEFRTSITFRRIPDRRYENHKDLRSVVEAARYETVEILVHPAG